MLGGAAKLEHIPKLRIISHLQ
ncbi:hypothetical protein [Acinetobacter gyllenbergii]